MKKVLHIILTVLLLTVCATALGAGLRVEWSAGSLTEGEVSVTIFGAGAGKTVILALYGEDGLEAVMSAPSSEDGAFLSVDVEKLTSVSRAKVFLWNGGDMRPAAATLSVITSEGVIDGSASSGPAVGSVEGKVTDNSGAPLENVEITLSAADFEPLTAHTAADGSYGFEAVPVGEYTVTAKAPNDMEAVGESEAKVSVTEDSSSAADFVFKPVTHYGSVEGKVTDNSDAPLEKVEITLSAEDFEPLTAHTAADGSYGFEAVPVGEYTVTAKAPNDMEAVGESEAKVSVTEDNPAAADFVFKPVIHYGSVEGKVTDNDGAPLENVEITLSAADFEPMTAHTAADGSYGFEAVPVGEYIVTASVGEYMEGERALKVTVRDGETSTADFTFVNTEPEVEKWYSDDQKKNRPSSIAYHGFEPSLTEEYEISFELKVAQYGDNAVLFHDGSYADPNYNNAAVTLLFNDSTGSSFAVKNGDGNGNYSPDTAQIICPAKLNETYKVLIRGRVDENSYTIQITDKNGQTYSSPLMHGRTAAERINSVALISNSHSTVVSGGKYTDYNFYVTGFTCEITVDDPVYDGFSGRYFAVKANGGYVRGNNGRLSADWSSPKDNSAMFLPRYMGDGSYAFVCLSSNRRMTAADSGQLASADYDYNGDSQHWLLEKSESYTDRTPAYYLKSLQNGRYVGVRNNYLTAVSEGEKAELVFEPVSEQNQSPLYLLSKTQAYARLSRKQRQRIEMIYETVAGDVFDRYSNDIANAEWTPRLRIDNIYNTNKDNDDALYNKLVKFLSGDDSHLITDEVIANNYSVSTSLPDTDGFICERGEGAVGTYDFWRGTMLKGVKYKLTVEDAQGNPQQSMDLYVQDDGNAKANADTFQKIFAKVPYVYRKNITSVKIRSDTANSYNCGANDLYIRVNWTPNEAQMLCTLCHELSHSNSAVAGNWANGAGWANAMAEDMISVSPYGTSNATEDFAEFGRLYFISYAVRDRQRAIQLLFPNRYASYYRLRHNNLGGFQLWEDTEYPIEY